ncbi:zinc finger CCCH domain-containing protein 13 isoform X1 [Austrofundulus limnaeus]|uniref:Zinc finger CCCH domain-containing protein 13 isoform X1 n=1 Tax=Austrofundulus limnaeus TaxID=52670 RepID=A0A2I4DAR4_AUSLI|nr:PREDICTED: zinc finger CCCH domain-containing protein 13-like isoform X1 [Austrofundulus limnaeus]
MAECSISIDKNKLPGVKEVCRDFAVLEDHSLAYNLQEQEIESHLASNVHKSRLVQQDLQWAKKLQMEEDEIAKIQSQKQQNAIARQDNEIAQEIQEELVRQEELQRLQEEKDAAIARQLQEKEKIREERRKQKQMEANIQEDYYEDRGAAHSLDVDKRTRQKSRSPGRHDLYSLERSPRDHTPDQHSTDPKKSGHPRQDSTAPRSHSKHPEQYLGTTDGGRSRHADPYPEHLLPSRGKHEDGYPEFESAHTRRAREEGGRDADRVVRRKERPERPPGPPSPNSPSERDEVWNKERQRHDRGRDYNLDKRVEKDYRRDREQDLRPVRDREEFRDRGTSGDRHREQDRPRQKDKDRQRGRSRDRDLQEDFLQDKRRGRSRDRCLDLDSIEQGRSRDRPRESRSSWEEDEVGGERRARSWLRVHSNPVEVFDECVNVKGQGDRETWDPQQGDSSHKETGRIVHKGSGTVIPETEYGLREATQGLTTLDLHEQELKDMEVARRLQEEEIKASNMHVRAAQLAKDEEVARRLAEHEKREYRKNREKERERLASEKMGMERRRHEGSYRANSEEIVRPRTRDEYDHHRQRNQHKSARPPQPHTHDYENVNPGYVHPASARPTTRPDAAYRGAYHKH